MNDKRDFLINSRTPEEIQNLAEGVDPELLRDCVLLWYDKFYPKGHEDWPRISGYALARKDTIFKQRSELRTE